ncbi:hypothetical protein AB6N24_08655 [Cellulomonas sp. 179-A 4D5 NHS]|uniref:hypothetical protein n=1 Tax=Cellulomonas sp. 179-A 4D5 NHS TaxID=3142378 RepID=UPI00399FF523
MSTAQPTRVDLHAAKAMLEELIAQLEPRAAERAYLTGAVDALALLLRGTPQENSGQID